MESEIGEVDDISVMSAEMIRLLNEENFKDLMSSKILSKQGGYQLHNRTDKVDNINDKGLPSSP